MLEIDKVITLANGEKYLVLDKTMSNSIYYYYIAKVNNTQTDIENNYKLITVEESNGNMAIVEVTGEDKLREVLPLFTKQL